MSEGQALREPQILTGSLFNERMRVVTVRAHDRDTWAVGLVGVQSERFRQVVLTRRDLESLAILDAQCAYDADGRLLRLGLQAYVLGIAYEFDPYFGLSISRADPLPHQLEDVYDYLLKIARIRFGKTIIAGLLIRELELRGLTERILIVCPANPTFQWRARAEGEVRRNVLGPQVRRHSGPVRRQPVDRAEAGHHHARPRQAGRDSARTAAGPPGFGRCGRSAPHVGRGRSPQDPVLQTGRTPAGHVGSHAAADGHAAQRGSRGLQPLPPAPRRRRLRGRPVHPRSHEPSPRALLPASHQGVDGILPGAPGGRDVGRREDLYEAHSAHRVIPDRRGGVRPLPQYHPLREAAARQVRITRRRPSRPRRRLLDVPLSAQAGDCYWLYIVTNCKTNPRLQEPIKDPARFDWREVAKVSHYWLEAGALTKPMRVREDEADYGTHRQGAEDAENP